MELSHSAPTNDTLSLWRIEVLIPAKYIDRMSGSAIDAGFSSYSVKWNGSGNLSTIQLLFQSKDREQVELSKNNYWKAAWRNKLSSSQREPGGQ